VRVCRVYLGPDVAYRLLQLLRRTGTQPGALTILAGTGTVMPFLFFVDLPRPLPCGSGDKRRAAQRPFVPTPVPVLPGFRQVCPTAIPIRTRHLRELPRRSTSGDQRARVRGPSNGRVFLPSVRGTFPCFSRPVHALRRVQCGRRSRPRLPLDIRCRRCVAERGGTLSRRRTEPRSTFRR
jgi:hypothetical protein